MANFIPLKNYLLFCLDRLVNEYGLTSPFLDIGCGIGDVSRHFALKGWSGRAIDFSEAAIKKAKDGLAAFKDLEIKHEALSQAKGLFNTVFCIDVLEHIEDDAAALNKIYSFLPIGGYLVLAVVSNPREWRWDDEFYGHCRRYDIEEIKERLAAAGFETVTYWDFTYPFFWIMRRVYVKLKHPPAGAGSDKFMRTAESSLVNAWDVPFLSKFLSKESILWNLLYKFQFRYFKGKIRDGHEMIVLARKIK